MYTFLNERSVFRISGEDRVKFLQGLLSNDITKISPDNSIYACMLTPQGKYFADFFLISRGDEILFDILKLRQSEILKKLNMYKLRSAVTINEAPHYQVISLATSEKVNLQSSIVFKDPRSDKLGMRGFINENDFKFLSDNFIEDENSYDNIRIDNFIAEGDKDLIPEKSFLAEYGLDNLNAIDYSKGCYVGQELVARTHYLGQVRKQIVQVHAKHNLPALGTEIHAGQQKLGIICSSRANKGLALVRTEDVLKLDSDAKITANDLDLELIFKEKTNA
jgi:folate-binding protein YgfZ